MTVYQSIKLVTMYFKCANLIESNLSYRTGFNEMYFNFPHIYLVIRVFSDIK